MDGEGINYYVHVCKILISHGVVIDHFSHGGK
jgi:hypothetical protein